MDDFDIFHDVPALKPTPVHSIRMCSDSGADGTQASSSNDSHYSGSRVETPVSYMGDDDDDDDYDENDDDD